MDSKQLLRLGKEVSYALRHNPTQYKLEVDEFGWCNVDDLIMALRKDKIYGSIDLADIELMMASSDKKRFELVDGRIRAFYGHSFNVDKVQAIPPDVLYHGTEKRIIDIILKEGLKPKQRQYVHLSQDVETAVMVGKRRDNNPVIFVIDAKKAAQEGVKFYYGNETVWLADYVSSKYLSIIE